MKSAATVVIHGAPKMNRKGRLAIARWLRSRAKLLEKHADLLASRFTSKYYYE